MCTLRVKWTKSRQGRLAHLERRHRGNEQSRSSRSAIVKQNSSRGAAGSIRDFLSFSYAEKPQLWAQASPILHVSKDSAAFLFLHGTKDETTPYEKSVEMMKRRQASGVRAELFTAEGAGHGFFNRPPWFEPTLKRMEEFFLSTLK